MCGRFTLTAAPEAIAAMFRLGSIDPFPPRYNIAPSQPILIVIGGADERPDTGLRQRSAMLVRWGLIPGWVKDLKGFPLLFNARSETVAEKNAFRAALRYRRCLVPASGFYEWRRRGEAKPQPYFLTSRGEAAFAFAGIEETWLSPDGSEIDTAAILTKPASGALASIHERMPVVIHSDDHDAWLNCREIDPAAAMTLARRLGGDVFEAVPVSDRVNSVANIGPDIQEAVAGEAPLAESPQPQGEDGAQFRLF
ncbi:SOS response-associated peptidase [Aurantimonas sp. VKM B-3413]|uniref:SOS response-associated peptidase n=1 Tax=Aurantimonas sp. VKM B-3413 TaxID=2779401 RepID=UPI001E63C031|nr:SOS response-associated peptidase [Aurantimonas sp. VKM B-3413]MCB8836029.1 SOS response-associated peptidase [Aurantimonas sp. VKM B-3413]